MADLVEEEVCRLKSDFPGNLETRGFSLLGWHYGNQEALLPIWVIYH
jgi:hypothetical protein